MAYLRTSDLADAVGIHPNTVRRYEEWGLIPPAARSPAGYRLFTQRHLDCLILARSIYSTAYPGRELRASGKSIIHWAVEGRWDAALESAQAHLALVEEEIRLAEHAANLLERWANKDKDAPEEKPLGIREAATLLGVSKDKLRNWERNGLITIPRNAYNNYRLFRRAEIERLRIINLLCKAGYSHMAILRMFIELEKGNTRNLKEVLDTPRADEDIFSASDHWLTTLHIQKKMAREILQFINQKIPSAKPTA